MKLIFGILICGLIPFAQADEKGFPGTLSCSDVVCTYKPKYIHKDVIQTFRNSVLICTYGDPNPPFPEGEFVAPKPPGNLLWFNLSENSKKSRFLECLKEADDLTESGFSEELDMIVWVQVYATEKGAGKELHAGLETRWSPENPIKTDLAPRFASLVADTGLAGVAFAAGNLMSTIFKFNFDFGRKNIWSAEMDEYKIPAQSGRGVQVLMTRSVYMPESFVQSTPVSAKAGIEVSFTPHLLKSGAIQLSDLNFYFASETNKKMSLVDKFESYSGSIIVNDGQSYMLAGKQMDVLYNKKTDSWIFARGSEEDTKVANTYVIITPFLKKRVAPTKELQGLCPQSDLKMLPTGDKSSFSTLLNKIEAGIDPMFSAPFGQKLYISVSSNVIDTTNANKSVAIEVFDSKKQLLKSAITTTNCLSSEKIYLPNINFDKFCGSAKNRCESIQYFVKLKYVRGDQSESYLSLTHEPGTGSVFLNYTKPFAPVVLPLQKAPESSNWGVSLQPLDDSSGG